MKIKEDKKLVHTINKDEESPKFEKLFHWMNKNPNVVDLINLDNSLSIESKKELMHCITELDVLSLSDGKPTKKEIFTSSDGLAKARQKVKTLDLDFKSKWSSNGDKKTSPHNDSHDSEDSLGSGRKSPLHSSKNAFRKSGSPGRKDENKIESPGRNENSEKTGGCRKKSNSLLSKSRPELRFFIPLETHKRANASDFDRTINSILIPVDSNVAKSYFTYALNKSKEGILKVRSEDDKYNLLVNEGEKQVYLIDEAKKIGKGGYADIFAAFNLKDERLVAAKIFSPYKKKHALEEQRILRLIDNYFTKNYNKKRYFGFYDPNPKNTVGDECILLKNYEYGVTLHDFLYEVIPSNKKYIPYLKPHELINDVKIKNEDTKLEKTALEEIPFYIEFNEHSITYTVKSSTTDKPVTDTLDSNFLPNFTFSKKHTIKDVLPYFNEIMHITSLRGHTTPENHLRKKYIPPFLILEIIHQIMEEVSKLHECGIRHRELNPRNIIIDINDYKPVIGIIDFDSATDVYLVELKKENSHIKKDTIYIEIVENALRYTLFDPHGKLITDTIDKNKLGTLFNSKITLQRLTKCLPKILESTNLKGHTRSGGSHVDSPGESPGYIPPLINNKFPPYDRTYDIWQLSIIIAGIISDKLVPELIIKMKYDDPSLISIDKILPLLDDVAEAKKQALELGDDSEENIINKVIYHYIIFPILCEMVNKMACGNHDDNFLSVEIAKLEKIERQCQFYREQITNLHSHSVDAHSTLHAIITQADTNEFRLKQSHKGADPLRLLEALLESVKVTSEIVPEKDRTFSM